MEENYVKLLKYEKEYRNLIKYEVSLLDHFKWEQKHRYFLLIPNFLDKKIDTDSKGFSKSIEELCSDCRIFEPDPDLRDDLEICEKQLRNGVKKTHLQIQEYF